VVASDEIMEGIKNSFRKVVGVEMEGFSIFQAAAEASKPNPVPMLIKSVCDYGTESKNDKYQSLAAYTSANFFLRFALKHLEPAELVDAEPPGIELVPWKHQKERENYRLTQLLDNCRKGSTVKFISITGKTFLEPEHKFKQRDAFAEAIKRGVRFAGVLLDPKCAEAQCRSEIESPKLQRKERLFVKDSASVAKKFAKASEAWKKNLEIRYSSIGIAFKLWFFEDVAYIEPYHFGKLEEERLKPESALCGFSHVWVNKSTPEYEMLHDHFTQLWNRCQQLKID